MKNKSAKLFIIALTSLFILDLTDKTRAFSSYEKRPLASLPKWDLDALIDGSLSLDLESYFNDQFIARDSWIKFKADLEAWMGKTENNGILFGKDGNLFEKRLTLNPQALLNKDVLLEFISKYPDQNLTTVLVPGKEAIYKEWLPTGFPSLDTQSLIDQWKTQLPLTDLTQTFLNHKAENLYYKTDHHWTLQGAYRAYEALMIQWGLEVTPLEAFNPQIIDGFLGTYFNKSRLESVEPEIMGYIDPAIISYTTDGKTTASLIDQSAFSGHDQYSAFLYGNHGFGHIVVRQRDQPKRLLVIKDSYANSLIPFMSANFDEIDVIDLRHFNGSLGTLMSSATYDHVLVLQSFTQFCDEVNEAKLNY